MHTEQQNKSLEISVNKLRYYFLWLQVSLLKLLSLGLYAPWGNQRLQEFLLTHTHCDNKKFNVLPSATKVFKVRMMFGFWLLVLFIGMKSLPELSWLFQLLFLISLPGFYLAERRYDLSSVIYNSIPIKSDYSLTQFYKSIRFPIAIFVLLAAVIFNSEIIDSQFLASIETKEEPSIYAEDSYLARAEQDLKQSEHDHQHSSGHSDENGSEHESKHGNETGQWNDSISEEEKAYLDEHEKSHNHGSISLSRLQKYQVASQGNQFIQYVFLLLLMSILWPWIDYQMIANRVEGTGYLKSSWTLKKGVVSLYALYAKVMLVVLAVIAISSLIISTFLMGDEGGSAEFWSNALVHGFWLFPLVVVISVFGFNLLIIWRKHWLLDNLESEQVAMKSHSSYTHSLLLSLTNTLLLIVTLGLAIPLCQLRGYRYFTHHLSFSRQ